MPPEVIDLLSSDDGAAAPSKTLPRKAGSSIAATPKVGPKKAPRSKAAPLGDLDFELDTPFVVRRNKRQRLSPIDDPIASSNTTKENVAPQEPPPKSPRLPADSDPIVFTSPFKPAPRNVPKARRSSPESSPIGGRSDDDLLDSSSPEPKERNPNVQKPLANKSKTSGLQSQSDAQKPTSTKSKTSAAQARAAAQKAEREQKKQDKAVSKEETAARKKFEREQKTRDKQREKALAEANKARYNKEISVKEMIVDLPASLQGKDVELTVKEILKEEQVETTTYTSLLPNVIRWRRKVSVEYDHDQGFWVPVPSRIEQEPHVLCFVEARDFVGMVHEATTEDESLEKHVDMVKTKFPGAKIIYLIQGLEAWLKKSKNARNREFQASARGENAKGKKDSAQTLDIDEDKVEDALLRLQVVHDCLVHHTPKDSESAEWIVHFTQHISTIPYRSVRDAISTTFCMDVGQVRTGEDGPDTYVKMLQQIVRVTAPIAYGVMRDYPSVEALVGGFEKHGPNMLEDLKKGSNRDGGVSDARIGPAISRRLEKVFCGKDPTSLDV